MISYHTGQDGMFMDLNSILLLKHVKKKNLGQCQTILTKQAQSINHIHSLSGSRAAIFWTKKEECLLLWYTRANHNISQEFVCLWSPSTNLQCCHNLWKANKMVSIRNLGGFRVSKTEKKFGFKSKDGPRQQHLVYLNCIFIMLIHRAKVQRKQICFSYAKCHWDCWTVKSNWS